MTKRLFIFSLLLWFGFSTQAQMAMHKFVHAGYVYQNQSFGEVGGRLLFLKHDDIAYRVGASAMIGTHLGKPIILPKLQGDVLINFERNVDFYHSYYFLGGAEITTQYVAPKIGISLFGIIDLSGGYSFPVNSSGIQGKELKGFNLNFTVNLPTVLIHDLLK